MVGSVDRYWTLACPPLRLHVELKGVLKVNCVMLAVNVITSAPRSPPLALAVLSSSSLPPPYTAQALEPGQAATTPTHTIACSLFWLLCFHPVAALSSWRPQKASQRQRGYAAGIFATQAFYISPALLAAKGWDVQPNQVLCPLHAQDLLVALGGSHDAPGKGKRGEEANSAHGQPEAPDSQAHVGEVEHHGQQALQVVQRVGQEAHAVQKHI